MLVNAGGDLSSSRACSCSCSCQRNEQSEVSYTELNKLLDWRMNALSLSASQLSKMTVKTLGAQLVDDPFANPNADATALVDRVNYRALLLDLYGDGALQA